MRKRKRESGSYVDEETGEVTTVQTTKQAKRIHQKTGKWYKEPTAKELRIWEREAKQKEAAEKASRREQNKKKNAAKRAEKEAKESELKKHEFFAGKITFTQTLAKKDEDQLNLHSWFGGKPQKHKTAQSLSKTVNQQDEDKEIEHQHLGEVAAESHTAHGPHHSSSVKRLSETFDKDGTLNPNVSHRSVSFPLSLEDTEGIMAEDQIMTDFEQDQDIDLSQSFEDFEIAEDLDAGSVDNGEEQLHPQLTNGDDSKNEFAIPAPPVSPKRLPLSPMSPSDVNIRNSQTQNFSDLKLRVVESHSPLRSATKATNIASTQMVKDLLSGLCTQDLADDDLLDDDCSDKENEMPGIPANNEERVDTAMKQPPSKPKSQSIKSPSKLQHSFKGFTSLNDSFDSHDYDNIFAELGDTIKISDSRTSDDDFDDGGLDDATLLSLPSTQILLSTTKATPSTSTSLITAPIDVSPRPLPMPTLRPFQQCDSFAVDGLSDHDLLQGLAEYEQSQSASASNSAIGKAEKKKRTLPWEKPGWKTETSGELSQEMADESQEYSQRTEILSQTFTG